MIRCSAGNFLAVSQVQAVRFPDLRYFPAQLCDALFDRLLHSDRLAEQADHNPQKAMVSEIACFRSSFVKPRTRLLPTSASGIVQHLSGKNFNNIEVQITNL
jgi:hypothetical protein